MRKVFAAFLLALALAFPGTAWAQTRLPFAPTLTANQLLGALSAGRLQGLSVPSCPGASQALNYTSGTGFGCNTISGGGGTPGGAFGTIEYNNAGAFGGFTLSGDGTINTGTGALTVTKTSGSAFVASATTDTTNATNITTGTLAAARVATLNQNTTGNAANVTGTVALANGGTGATSAQAALNALAAGVTSGSYLRGNGTNVVLSAIQAGDVNASNITSGTLPAAQLPNPSATTLGGVQSLAAAANQWMTAISTSGVPSRSQPAFSNLSGSATAAQLPTTGTGTLVPLTATATTWTPADSSGAGVTFATPTTSWQQVGNTVYAYVSMTVNTTSDTTHPPTISGLPVAVPNANYAQIPCNMGRGVGNTLFIVIPVKATSTAAFYNAGGNATTWSALSGATLTFALIYPAS